MAYFDTSPDFHLRVSTLFAWRILIVRLCLLSGTIWGVTIVSPPLTKSYPELHRLAFLCLPWSQTKKSPYRKSSLHSCKQTKWNSCRHLYQVCIAFGNVNNETQKPWSNAVLSLYTPNLPTKIVDFRGFDSSIILIYRGGILMSMGDFPDDLSQAMLVGCNVSREIGRIHIMIN